MALKKLLVVYGGNAEESGGLRVAVDLAVKHGAAITGVVTLGPTHIEGGFSRFISSGISEIIDARDAKAVAEARDRFGELVAQAGLAEGAAFLSIESDASFDLCDLACGFDLVVYCDHPLEDGRAHFAQTPADVAMGAGCPVLLVPANFAGSSVVGPALLAWDERRAAARAIGDALHLGLLGQGASLLTIGPAEAPTSEASLVVIARLAAHGVEARPLQRPVARGGIARSLLDQAKASGASFVVMGAFEHSRLRETFLGGVTVEMLAQHEIPVLMSH